MFRLITTSGGTVSLTNLGSVTLTSASVTRVGTNSKAYTITFPSAHPNGSAFMVMAVPQTASSTSWDSTASNDYVCTVKVESSTAMTIWCRRPGYPPTTGMIDGNFYVYTVP